jgi:small conductance mechanosensitive channel
MWLGGVPGVLISHKKLKEQNMTQVSGFMTKISENAIDYVPVVILALVTLLVGLWIIRVVLKGLNKAMQVRKMDESLQRFLHSLLGIMLKMILGISVIGILGVSTTSFVAVLGAAGLAVGLALQGGLANFAGGVIILIFRPFKIGDVIEAQGYVGKVHEIQVFNTVLKTPDNKTIIIPNGGLSNGSMVNYSTEAERRVDMTFGIGYGDDIEKSKVVLKGLIDTDSRILNDPEPAMMVSELADSSVNIAVRVWCNAADYWGIYFDMQEKVKLEFDKQGISIPYPQTDVHVIKE